MYLTCITWTGLLLEMPFSHFSFGALLFRELEFPRWRMFSLEMYEMLKAVIQCKHLFVHVL